MSARTHSDGRPCPVTGFDCLTCEAGCHLLQPRNSAMASAMISALLSQDPSIPAARLAPVSRWMRFAAAVRAWGWRSSLEDLVGLVSLLALCWLAALILAAFGPDYGAPLPGVGR